MATVLISYKQDLGHIYIVISRAADGIWLHLACECSMSWLYVSRPKWYPEIEPLKAYLRRYWLRELHEGHVAKSLRYIFVHREVG